MKEQDPFLIYCSYTEMKQGHWRTANFHSVKEKRCWLIVNRSKLERKGTLNSMKKTRVSEKDFFFSPEGGLIKRGRKYNNENALALCSWEWAMSYVTEQSDLKQMRKQSKKTLPPFLRLKNKTDWLIAISESRTFNYHQLE